MIVLQSFIQLIDLKQEEQRPFHWHSASSWPPDTGLCNHYETRTESGCQEDIQI